MVKAVFQEDYVGDSMLDGLEAKRLKANVLCLSVLNESMVATDMKFNFKKENIPL